MGLFNKLFGKAHGNEAELLGIQEQITPPRDVPVLILPRSTMRAIQQDVMAVERTNGNEMALVAFLQRGRWRGRAAYQVATTYYRLGQQDYDVRSGEHASIKGIVFDRVGRRAKQTGQYILFIHTHPPDGHSLAFSPLDHLTCQHLAKGLASYSGHRGIFAAVFNHWLSIDGDFVCRYYRVDGLVDPDILTPDEPMMYHKD